jgi:hypothetical protein
MEKISFEVTASDATIKPDDYNNIRVEVDGVQLSDLIESIDNNSDIFEIIINSEPQDWVTGDELSNFLDNFANQQIAEYLENQGWKMAEAESD